MIKHLTTLLSAVTLCITSLFSTAHPIEQELDALPFIKNRHNCYEKGTLKQEEQLQLEINRINRYDDSVFCQVFWYESDGFLVEGFITLPTNISSPISALVFQRGGNHTFNYIDAKKISMMNFIASKGFAVITTQLRGADKETYPWDKNPDQFGGDEVNDIIKLKEIVLNSKVLRKEKIGILGISRGGMLALQAARKEKLFSPIVVANFVPDLAAEIKTPYGMRLEKIIREQVPNYALDKEKQLKERSPIEWIDQLNKDNPILIMHNKDDERIPASETLRFATKLQELNHKYKLIIFEDGDHKTPQPDFYPQTISWFKTYLNP